ncbi:DUF1439 domain-containing protein [Mannheimia sp. AT1]|uniref:DUF1439 domain-containing protein n=1 Tax=Mannheimia cairinae TaxID=3025936 RepID=A0ABT5MN96_9PAST|nr:DUF1439 domain-containing protein [Mannheimia cairinae]MDD0823654.1 DUF1439 domain-containing protein [Mannheimia cairinae]MDD0825414.1 DUF1439 domain-containing protein [Mannheimia cairinae]
MRILRKLSILVISFGAILSSNASLLSISEAEINDYLATKLNEKVPLQDKIGIPNLFELNYNLHSLKTQIGRTDEKKVAISGIVDGILKIRGKKYNATITLDMDTVPYYDAEKGALFLKDVRLLSWSAQPNKYQNELQMFLPMLAEGLSYFLNNTPIYTLDDNKMREAMVKKFGKSILIEEGIIKLETSIF